MKNLYTVNSKLRELKSVEEVLEYCGLNWNVIQEDLYLINGYKVPNTKINLREYDKSILGIVSERYEPINNAEAFAFVNELLKSNLIIEQAGEINDGKNVYLCANIGNRYVDAIKKTIECKLIFTNSHTGKGSIKVNILPLIDNCPINLCLNAKRNWRAIHSINVKDKMNNAKKTLSLSESYFEELIKETNLLNKIHLTESQIETFIENMFPKKPNMSDKQIENVMEDRNYFKYLLNGSSAFDLILTTGKYINMAGPRRNTKNFENNKFMNIVNGYYLLDNAYLLLKPFLR